MSLCEKKKYGKSRIRDRRRGGGRAYDAVWRHDKPEGSPKGNPVCKRMAQDHRRGRVKGFNRGMSVLPLTRCTRTHCQRDPKERLLHPKDGRLPVNTASRFFNPIILFLNRIQ